MSSVRAKFKVDSITLLGGTKAEKNGDGEIDYVPCEMRSIRMTPVYGNGDPEHENTKFWQASPGGSLEMNVMNADAAAVFELGKEYYLDFTLAE